MNPPLASSSFSCSVRTNGAADHPLMKALILLLIAASLFAVQPRHVKVYEQPGRFGGWPANHGIWSWGDEILVGFSAAWYEKKGPDRHQASSEKPEEPRLARSLDGGETWTIEAPKSLLPPEQGGATVTRLDHPIDFKAPGFLMTLRFTDIHKGASRLWYSMDKGRNWKGPYEFPLFGAPGIAARTDYIIDGKHDATVFVTAAKSNAREGRPVCVRTTDGGRSWKEVAKIGPEPAGFSIMPSSLRLGRAELLTTVRVKNEPENWIEQYRSLDNGATWTTEGRVANTGVFSGNPPSLIRLKDGRLCVTYGHRSKPYAIRAKISRDPKGHAWGEEITLRDDAAAWDIGYPRSTQRKDGKVVTIYYYNDAPHRERFIAATIWDPNK